VITSAGEVFCPSEGGTLVQSDVPQPVLTVDGGHWLTTSGDVVRYLNEPVWPPQPEVLLTGATALEASLFHACALKTPGSVWCWGDAGLIGVLGPDTDYPVQVTSLGTSVTAISGGYDYTCARTSAGAALCWGRGVDGQHGH
jgi:hypothetical protein